MADFKEIDNARKVLGLSEYAALEEINAAYRKLALKWHPDKCKGAKKPKCEEKFKKIAHAKDLLSAYCAGYRFSFKEKDVKRNSYNKDFYKHLQKFYDGWWGEI
ncbi:MAG: DnaJ domain-containing protein [Candidatus Omnitrophica bacterium]|nr:DnaJ domain-containing protein [Candidatus Omnitrophota bacterium]MDD5429874.1 DnaJ domain-containing protein [Candidatus Omnitrophota bacterium]